MKHKRGILIAVSFALIATLLEPTVGSLAFAFLAISSVLNYLMDRGKDSSQRSEIEEVEARLRGSLSLLTNNPFEAKLFKIDERAKKEVLASAEALTALESDSSATNRKFESFFPAIVGVQLIAIVALASARGITSFSTLLVLITASTLAQVALFDHFSRSR